MDMGGPPSRIHWMTIFFALYHGSLLSRTLLMADGNGIYLLEHPASIDIGRNISLELYANGPRNAEMHMPQICG